MWRVATRRLNALADAYLGFEEEAPLPSMRRGESYRNTGSCRQTIGANADPSLRCKRIHRCALVAARWGPVQRLLKRTENRVNSKSVTLADS